MMNNGVGIEILTSLVFPAIDMIRLSLMRLNNRVGLEISTSLSVIVIYFIAIDTCTPMFTDHLWLFFHSQRWYVQNTHRAFINPSARVLDSTFYI
jgi:hypothetical protein